MRPGAAEGRRGARFPRPGGRVADRAPIYLNSAGTSWPKPPGVREAVASALAQDPSGNGDLLRGSRETICRFLGIAHPSRLVLTPGCTSALAVALEDLPWEDGEAVVTSSLEHHALARPVRRLAGSRGVIHHQAPRGSGGPIDLDFVESRLKAGRARLVAVTAASNVTGELLPVDQLGGLAHRHGALLLVDAAQTAGMLPLDLERGPADIVTFAGHKGPLGPQGVGGLWARPGVTFRSPAATCEIGSGAAEACSAFPGSCDVGSVNLPGIAGLAAGMAWLERSRPGDPGRIPRDLARRLVEGLAGMPGVTVVGAAGAPRTATVSIRMESLPVAKAEAFFRERGLIVRAGLHCAPMALAALGVPGGTIRISFGHFSTEEDLAAILRAVEEAQGPPAGRR